METLTAVEQLQGAWAHIDSLQNGAIGDAAREFALAKTAIEDAIMRTNRGVAKQAGTFKVADVERDTPF